MTYHNHVLQMSADYTLESVQTTLSVSTELSYSA